jgi:hypothetical protein
MNLNENQKQHLISTFEHIDQLLKDVELILSSEQSKYIFQQYFLDVSTDKIKEFDLMTAKFRTSMSSVLKLFSISSRANQISATRLFITTLNLVDIALEESRSRYMRGYGELTQATASELDYQVTLLQDIIARIKQLFSEQGVKDW